MWASLVAQKVKDLSAVQWTLVQNVIFFLFSALYVSLNKLVRIFPTQGAGNGYPLYSCLENSMDRGAWQATVHGVSKSWT